MNARRFILALCVGLLGAVFIWFAAPYNNFILANAFISDDFLPVAAVGLIMLLVLGVNPLLHRFAPNLKLTFAQLTLIFGILLTACITPGQGFLRHIFYPIGATPSYVSSDATIAAAYEELDLHETLFPEPLGLDADVPASDYFVDELPPGESIPWGKWIGPLWSWGGFFLPYWLMLIAMALIVLPYWRDTERQPFPLLEVQRTLIEDCGGKALPPVLSNKLFWTGFGLVLVLHLMLGLNQYFPDRVPAIKLQFDLSTAFTEHPVRYLPSYIKSNQIHFLFLGIAFFMPNRVGFSIWFLQVAYAIFIMIRSAYVPPYDGQMLTDQRLGAWIALPLGILWLGRRHWWTVLRSVFRRPDNDEAVRNKVAGTALLIGLAGMLLWLLWVRVPFLWAIALVAIMFLFALGLTRIVAETGVPLMAPDSHYLTTLASLVPAAWRTAAGMYFSGIVGIISGHLNRVCTTTIFCHALGLDKNATPRRHVRLATILFGVLILSVLIGGAFQLALTYRHATSLDGVWSPVGYGGAGYFKSFPEPLLKDFVSGRVIDRPYNQWGHILFGGGLAVFLQTMCQLSAKWPVHPVALLFVGNWYAHRIWFSVLLGWLIKVLVVRYGGARAYRSSRTAFLGLIIGEVAAVVLWAIVTAVVAALGLDYKVVTILPF